MKNKTISMTSGSIPRHLLKYAIPAILGDLFQVTYNTVDTIIVGKFAGTDALAAVSIANPIMSVAMFFLIGLGIGASILMSNFYGAEDIRSLRKEFSTATLAGLACSFFLAALLFILTNPLLRLCNTPTESMTDTAAYLRIVSCGMLFTGAYNMFAAASKSVGNTKTPLICLIVGSLTNVVLDLLFVAVFDMGVSGAAIATVIAQGVSALLCAILLWKNIEPLRITKDEFGIEKSLLKKTFLYSSASALQQAGVYIGKLVVQSLVNPLGTHAIAAFGAVNRIDDYALIPERDIANGMTVLLAQNRGAKKPERMTKGFATGLLFETVYGLIVSVAVFSLAPLLMRLFVSSEETEVIALGTRYLRLMGFFYFMPGITNGLQGYMRAVGKINTTMFVTYSQMFVRAVMTWLLISRMELDAVAVACVGGWILMMIWEFGLIIYWKTKGIFPHCDK